MSAPDSVRLAVERPKRPARASARPHSVDTISDWSVRKVRSALDAHERGDFQLSAQLVDAMGRDDRIAACLGTRIKALTSKAGLAFSVEPSEEGDRRRSRSLAREVLGWWYDALPEATLGRILRDAVMLGVSISRIDWGTGRTWEPTVHPWPMQHVSWDDSAEAYAVHAREGRILVRRDDPSWLVVELGADRSWMDGLVRALGLPFIMRQLSYRDWGRFSERHGLPILKVTEIAGYSEEERAAFRSSLSTMGSSGVVFLPRQMGAESGDGFDVEFLEATDTSWQSFEAYRRDLNASIAITILGQNLTTEVQGGSLAAARVQDRVRADYLAADAEMLSTATRYQLVVPWLAYNHGSVDLDSAPWPTWDTSPAAEELDEATALDKAADAAAKLAASGLRVDWLAFAEKTGIPLLPGPAMDEERDEPTTPPAVPPDATQEPEGDEDDDEPDDDDEEPAEGLSVRLASGDDVRLASGFVDGQRYIDALTASFVDRMQRGIAPTVRELIAVIGEARTYDEARAAIVRVYRDAQTSDVERLAERAIIVSELAGRAAIMEDL